jgi:hypothetical protein
MKRSPLHTRKLILFLVLSAADLGLTWYLLSSSEGRVYESNPVADWWLARCGWFGLAAFKVAMASIFLGLTILVTFCNPRAGGRLAGFACGVVAVVVGYSLYLTHFCKHRPLDADPELAPIYAASSQLDRKIVAGREYQNVLRQLSQLLVSDQIDLAEAIDQLARTEKARDPEWIAHLQECYPGQPLSGCLAANLLQAAVASQLGDPARARQICRRLTADYEAFIGLPLSEEGALLLAQITPPDEEESDSVFAQ